MTASRPICLILFGEEPLLGRPPTFRCVQARELLLGFASFSFGRQGANAPWRYLGRTARRGKLSHSHDAVRSEPSAARQCSGRGIIRPPLRGSSLIAPQWAGPIHARGRLIGLQLYLFQRLAASLDSAFEKSFRLISTQNFPAYTSSIHYKVV